MKGIHLAAFAICALLMIANGCRSTSPQDSIAQVTPEEWADVLGQQPKAGAAQTQSNVSQASATSRMMHRTSSLPALVDLKRGDNFDQIVANTQGTVLVDFYADWCGPCKSQSKVLHSLEGFAAENGSQILKVDVDAHKKLAKQFQVKSLPTLLVIKNGEVIDKRMGYQEESKIRELLR